jgi:peptidylprolyl isomerase
MSRKTIQIQYLLIALAVALGACSTATNTSPTAGATTAGVTTANTPAPTVAAADASADIAKANSPAESPCIGAQPAAGENIQPNGGAKWAAPENVVDPSHVYCAIFTTNNGRIVAQLFPRLAPKNVNNFVFLAKNGFYENITWHRVLANFMAQSGDPTGTGAGGPGYDNIPLEAVNGLNYDREGRIGVARTGDPNSAGSQFFITFAAYPSLSQQYTIIGQVVEGLTVLHQIKLRDPEQSPTFKGDPLVSVRIVDLGAAK